MSTLFKTVLAVAGLFLIVPLAVWAGTGKPRHAWFALKQFLQVMAIITIPAVAISLIAIGLELIN